MVLKAVHDSIDDIPEQYRDLYTEKGDQWELTGISGIKTSADIARLQSTLEKERQATKEVKDRLALWGDLDHDEVMAKLDRLPELEAAAKDKLDEAGIEEIVQKRVEGTLRSKTGPLERELKKIAAELAAAKEENDGFHAKERQRRIHDAVREQLIDKKVLNEAHEDALLLAERVFDVSEDGAVITRDNVGVTPGIGPGDWLQEIQDKRRHWWPESRGSGAKGSGPRGMGSNPWSKDGWNLTKQGALVREHGEERARQMASAAGVDFDKPMRPS